MLHTTQKARPLAPLVKQHADSLRPKWRQVTDAARTFIPQLLTFAVAYRAAYEEIREQLGSDAVKQLNGGIGLTDSAASRMRDIADAHDRLKPHVALLPASVDAIHSVAVLATDQPKSFERAVKQGDITPSLTVRDARLLQPRRRAVSGGKSHASGETWRVQLSFDSRSDAAETVAELLSKSTASVRVPDASLRDDIKERVGKEHWAKVANRVSK